MMPEDHTPYCISHYKMALPSPGKTSLWYADDAGRRHITVSARGLLSSGKWGTVVKILIQQRRKRTRMNGRESQRWHQRSRCQSSEALPVLGVPQLPIGRRLSKGVSARTVTFWRLHRRQQCRPPSLLPLSTVKYLKHIIFMFCIKKSPFSGTYENGDCCILL